MYYIIIPIINIHEPLSQNYPVAPTITGPNYKQDASLGKYVTETFCQSTTTWVGEGEGGVVLFHNPSLN